MCSSETSEDFRRSTRRYIPEDRTLHNHRCENLISYKPISVFTHEATILQRKKGDVSSRLLTLFEDLTVACILGREAVQFCINVPTFRTNQLFPSTTLKMEE
jgi:hypothetical protein